jgi:hypothetical protein
MQASDRSAAPRPSQESLLQEATLACSPPSLLSSSPPQLTSSPPLHTDSQPRATRELLVNASIDVAHPITMRVSTGDT